MDTSCKSCGRNPDRPRRFEKYPNLNSDAPSPVNRSGPENSEGEKRSSEVVHLPANIQHLAVLGKGGKITGPGWRGGV